MTTVRLLLFIPYYYLIQQGDFFLAGVTYFVALVTDLDGTVARSIKATTTFGAIYDPVVDAAFMLGGFALLLQHSRIAALPVYIFLAAAVYKFIPQLMYLLRNKRVKSTYVSKALGFAGFGSVLLATFGAPEIITTLILVLGAAGYFFLGTYWFSPSAR